MTAIPHAIPLQPPLDAGGTFWEGVAQTRWGRYITSIERESVLAAASAFPTPGRALEVGCDGGRWCQLLIERGWKMTATDTNRQALALCQKRMPSISGILVSPQDERLPVGSGTMDLLLCLEVPAIAAAWFRPEARRVLKPGGILVGVLLNRCSWRGVLNVAQARWKGIEPLYQSTYASFRRSLRDCGFRVTSQRGCCWPPFPRKCNSRWVAAGASVERHLGLQRLAAFSPWIVFSATRL
jgi:SAM-dependent methyltransferase